MDGWITSGPQNSIVSSYVNQGVVDHPLAQFSGMILVGGQSNMFPRHIPSKTVSFRRNTRIHYTKPTLGVLGLFSKQRCEDMSLKT